MALPSGVATKVVSLGKYYAPDGTLSTSWTAKATISQEIRWAATGDVVEQIDTQIVKAPDGSGSIRLPVTDQSGWIDAAGAPITGWTYTIIWTSTEFTKRPRVFGLLGSVTDPYDVDNVSVGASIPTVPPGVQAVTSITLQGVTYPGPAVTLPYSAGGAGASTVQGITDATTIGKSLLLAADTASARNVIGLDQVANTADLGKPISTATQSALTALSSSLSGQITALSNQLATLTAVLAGKLDASTHVLLYVTKVGGTWQPRPVTAANVPVLFISPDGSNPPAGGTVGGGAGMVDGLDLVALGS